MSYCSPYYNSFYHVVKNNKEAQQTEVECNVLNKNILKHLKLLEDTHVVSMFVEKFEIEYPSDSIFGVKVIISFMTDKKQCWPPEQFEMRYIPIINKSENKKYYVLIKDQEAFMNTDLRKYTFDIKNYRYIFTVAELTPNHPTIENIIVNQFMVYKKTHNEELFKFVVAMMAEMTYFMESIVKQEYFGIVTTSAFKTHSSRTSFLLRKLVENDKLKYGIDYELDVRRANNTFLPIPFDGDLLLATREEKAFMYGKINNVEAKITSHNTSVHPIPRAVHVPDERWINFFGGLEISEHIDGDSFLSEDENPDQLVRIPLLAGMEKLSIFRSDYLKCTRVKNIEEVPRVNEEFYKTYLLSEFSQAPDKSVPITNTDKKIVKKSELFSRLRFTDSDDSEDSENAGNVENAETELYDKVSEEFEDNEDTEIVKGAESEVFVEKSETVEGAEDIEFEMFIKAAKSFEDDENFEDAEDEVFVEKSETVEEAEDDENFEDAEDEVFVEKSETVEDAEDDENFEDAEDAEVAGYTKNAEIVIYAKYAKDVERLKMLKYKQSKNEQEYREIYRLLDYIPGEALEEFSYFSSSDSEDEYSDEDNHSQSESDEHYAGDWPKRYFENFEEFRRFCIRGECEVNDEGSESD